VAVIGHDNLPASAFTDPSLSTMETDAADVGRHLAEILIARLGGEAPDRLQIVLPVRQVPRASHGGKE
jgi:LacI family transcriptional regulator